MEKSRRTFLKKSLAGAILLGTGGIAHAELPEPAKSKAPKAVNPFHLGMAGFTFAKFDIDTTLKTLKRLGVHYLCIKDFHLPFNNHIIINIGDRHLLEVWKYMLIKNVEFGF